MRIPRLWHWMAIAAAMFLASQGASAADFSAGLGIGYSMSFAARGEGLVTNFAQGFPFGLGFAITYTGVDPGDPWGARRIFIANAHNGTPEKHGETWDFRMDFMYKIGIKGPRETYLYAGVRNSFFDGTFRYVGANEEFDVTSDQWGVGLGAKGLFEISSRVDLSLTLGVDSYFDGSLHGHDTTYSPNNENVNPHENFTYEDAAGVINTPKFVPVLMIGLSYNL